MRFPISETVENYAVLAFLMAGLCLTTKDMEAGMAAIIGIAISFTTLGLYHEKGFQATAIEISEPRGGRIYAAD